MSRRHQWIFITDTVDAIYRPDDCEPEALLDRLAEVVGDLPAAEVSETLSPDVFRADYPPRARTTWTTPYLRHRL